MDPNTPPGFGTVEPDELDDGADELDDLAAELDDSDPGDYDDDPEPDDDPYVVLRKACIGGPYAGRTITSRFPKGFLLVDRPTSRAWLYDATDAAFVCRDGLAPMVLDTAGRWRAAEEPDFDVIAYDIDEVPV